MDKSRVCMSRTINLAKQKNLNKTTQLVYDRCGPEDTKCRKPTLPRVPPIRSMAAKKIRVCTGAEMKKICRPPPCSCPPKNERLTFFKFVCQCLGFGVKSFIAASLLYWTWEAGIWGDSEDTEMFYSNVCRMLTKGGKIRELSESCEAEQELMQVPPPPEDRCLRPPIDRERTMQRVKEAWNTCVTTIFESVVGFPHNLIRYVQEKRRPEVCTPVKSK